MTERTVSGWTRERALSAIREWHEEHGQPPRVVDWSPSLARRQGREDVARRWEDARPRWPRANVVERLFGRWSNGLVEAGYAATQAGVVRARTKHQQEARDGASITSAWTRKQTEDALRRWRTESGRWPYASEWRTTNDGGWHPTEHVVTGLYGSWANAISAAGGNATRKPIDRPDDSVALDQEILRLAVQERLTIQAIADRVRRDRSNVSRRLARQRRDLEAAVRLRDVAEVCGMTDAGVWLWNIPREPRRPARAADVLATLSTHYRWDDAYRLTREAARLTALTPSRRDPGVAAAKTSHRRSQSRTLRLAQAQRIVDSRSRGVSYREIAAAENLHSPYVVNRILGDLRIGGLDLAPPGSGSPPVVQLHHLFGAGELDGSLKRRWTVAEEQRLVDLWWARATAREIARELNRSRTTVVGRVSVLRRRGIALPYRNNRGEWRDGAPLGPAPTVVRRENNDTPAE